MGSVVAKSMNDNMKRNQEFMMDMNRVTMERQIQMQNQIRERMVALQIARARELLVWFGAFYAVSAVGILAGFRKSRRSGILVPLVPLTFILGYQTDLAYGNKLHRIRAEAENIMQFENQLLGLPCSLPTLSTIDIARQEQQEERMNHSSQPVLYY